MQRYDSYKDSGIQLIHWLFKLVSKNPLSKQDIEIQLPNIVFWKRWLTTDCSQLILTAFNEERPGFTCLLF